MREGTLVAVIISFLAASTAAAAENWPEWRGPRGDGVSMETGLPLEWNALENVAWKTPLEGLGTSTPVVWGDLLFLTSQIGMGPIDGRGAEFPEAVTARDYAIHGGDGAVRFAVEAFHRKDGRRIWQHRFEADGLPAVHPKHNLASPSCATDGEHVYAWFGTGQLLALTMSGDVAWERNLGRELGSFDVLWGHGSSPKLLDETVVLLVDHPGGAYMLAVDKSTGRTAWRVDREDGIRSYTTPFLVRGPDRAELVVNSSHRIESYDPRTGELLWHAGEPVTLAIPVPVYADGVLYASRGYSSGPYSAIRVGGAGDVSDTRVLWHVPTRAPYISSFVHYEGLLFMATERGIATVIDPKDGATLWRERLGGSFAASPVAGDGKVYLVNESGDAFVLAPSRTPEVLARNSLGERTLASPAIAGGRLYLRTDEHLIAIGER